MPRKKKGSETSTPDVSTKATKSRSKKTAVAEKPEQTLNSNTPQATSASPRTKVPPSREVLHEKIRVRAYEIFQERGGQHGLDEQDWFRAEAEVLSKHLA